MLSYPHAGLSCMCSRNWACLSSAGSHVWTLAFCLMVGDPQRSSHRTAGFNNRPTDRNMRWLANISVKEAIQSEWSDVFEMNILNQWLGPPMHTIWTAMPCHASVSEHVPCHFIGVAWFIVSWTLWWRKVSLSGFWWVHPPEPAQWHLEYDIIYEYDMIYMNMIYII